MKISHQGGFLIDMDGVICTGETLPPGAREFFAQLIRLNQPFLILTNNSEPTPQTVRARLSRAGLDIPISSIYTSALATVTWAQTHDLRKRVMVIGETGLRESLTQAGYILTDQQPDWIAVGETRHLDYEDLCTAVALAAQGAPLVATNPDVLIPRGSKVLIGCGAVVAMLEKAAGVQAVVVGKPHQSMFQAALRHLNLRPDQALMIGDNLDTDIAGAHRAGLSSILVLSGVTKADQLASSPIKPTYVVANLGDVELI